MGLGGLGMGPRVGPGYKDRPSGAGGAGRAEWGWGGVGTCIGKLL